MVDGRVDFENLEVWQLAMRLAEFAIDLAEKVAIQRKHFRIIEQLESASLSIPQNIAEGKGRFSKNEFLQFLYYSRGSLNETHTILIMFFKKGWIDQEEYNQAKIMINNLGGKLNALINSIKRSIKK